MALIGQDFNWTQGDRGTLILDIEPPVALDGRSLVWTLSRRFGGSGLITKSVASGFNGASGITIVSGQSQAQITINPADTSGMDVPYAYAHQGSFTDTARRVLEGYMIMEG